MRPGVASTPPPPALTTSSDVQKLSVPQARALSGHDIDGLTHDGLLAALGSKWLMQKQECDYNPPSRSWSAHSDHRRAAQADVAILMVDHRSPMPYHVTGTRFASPREWGWPRVSLSSTFLPPRWGHIPSHQAREMAASVMAALAGLTAVQQDEATEEELEDAAGGGDSMADMTSHSSAQGSSDSSSGSSGYHRKESTGGIRGERKDNTAPRVEGFHLALVINHIFAQLHGHTFYLEAPCSSTFIGVNSTTWASSVSSTLPAHARKFTNKHERYLRAAVVCAALPSTHRLGPFPARPPAWSKLAALRYVAQRHAHVLYMDSDAYITRIWAPIEPLISLLGLDSGVKWLAVAEEWPPQKLRGDKRAGLLNSGVFLLSGVPAAGTGVLKMIEDWIWPSSGLALAAFSWPFEQNALTAMLLQRYPQKITVLLPGCPINSPFGAYIRHYVGGTPDRSIYHPHHRSAWLLAALRCTVGLVAAASEQPNTPAAQAGLKNTYSNGSTANNTGANDLLQHSMASALKQREGCAPNELTVRLAVGAGCGGDANPDGSIYHDVRPVGATALGQLSLSCWRACCALCASLPACAAWAFHEDWPPDSINCILLDGFANTQPASGRFLGVITSRRHRARSTMVAAGVQDSIDLRTLRHAPYKEVGATLRRTRNLSSCNFSTHDSTASAIGLPLPLTFAPCERVSLPAMHMRHAFSGPAAASLEAAAAAAALIRDAHAEELVDSPPAVCSTRPEATTKAAAIDTAPPIVMLPSGVLRTYTVPKPGPWDAYT